ncbi:RNA-binding domain-containing protein [Pseudomonas sp. WS 5011]|uniref:RNA-binding domain-containing protein n=1 Tax=Pseudomonas sp. WS 5011 TaxID=2717477 RepID=UPI001474F5F1|nr:RNA-binding domain-containing protein [Pseudomonas sp. WS 5011]NMY51919.1 hypothetical protein [Pseudomonas sp. WS 5011]
MYMKSAEQIIEIISACRHVDSELLESDVVEFKEFSGLSSLHGSKELAEEISALANHKGGIVLVGIKDGSNVSNKNWSSQLVGFEPVDSIELEQRLRGKIKPYLDIKVQNIAFDHKNYVVIHVPTRRDILVATSSGKTCIRDGRSSRPMMPEEIKSAVSGLLSYDWTADTLENLDFSCFDIESVASAYKDYCIRKEYSVEKLPLEEAFLEAIGVTSNGKPTKAGLLFLGKADEIAKWLGVYEYRFSWRTRSGQLIINDVWDSNIWDTIDRAKRHFDFCNMEIELSFRGDKYKCKTLDDSAFHEGFMNALVHRDYSIEGMVVVDYDNDKLVVTNPGVFYGGVTPENIGTHQPRHRNKALAKMLMNFQLVDRAGMGVKRMGLGSLAYGREFPEFKESFDTVEVALSAKAIIPSIFIKTQTNPSKYGVDDLIIFNSLYRVGYKVVADLTKRLKGIVSDPWAAIKDAVARHEEIELCGTKDGVFVRIKPKWADFFDVRQTLKINRASDKHVKVFDYLMEFSEGSNENFTKLLAHKKSTHTSAFLREAAYVARRGNGPGARWYLSEVGHKA